MTDEVGGLYTAPTINFSPKQTNIHQHHCRHISSVYKRFLHSLIRCIVKYIGNTENSYKYIQFVPSFNTVQFIMNFEYMNRNYSPNTIIM